MTGMTDNQSLSMESLSIRNQVDRICDEFDRALATSQRQVIEVVVDAADISLREILLIELIAVEFEYRRRSGETGLEEHYGRRFPYVPAVIEQAIGMTDVGEMDEHSKNTGRVRSTFDVLPPKQVPQPALLQMVGPYRLEEKLGQGGMGVVFRATHAALNRSVALKMVRVAIDEASQRFETEARVIASLKHPNIVQIFDVGVFNERSYLALELMTGGSLADRIRSSVLSPSDAAHLVRRLTDAVRLAHSQGVIHRDLKPANVLLDNDGTPKLSDFGLARLQDVQSQTLSGALMGTPGFMAPEQTEGAEITPAVDLYGLGAVLYASLTGLAPFHGRNIPDTLTLVRESEPVGVRILQPEVPVDLESICLKCLQKSPQARYRSAEELIDDLDAFLQGRPTLARPVGPLARMVRWCIRRPATAAMMAGFFLSVTMGLAGVTWQWLEARAARDTAQASLEDAKRDRTDANVARNAAESNELKAQISLQKAIESVDVMLTAVARDELNGVPRVDQVRRELLENALIFLEQLLKDHPESPMLRFEAAKASQRVSDIYRLLGRYIESADASDRSVALMQPLMAESPENSRYLNQLASAWNHRATHQRIVGDDQQAETCLLKAIEYRRKSLSSQPGDTGGLLALADDLTQLGTLLIPVNRYAEADQHLAEGLQICEELAQQQSTTEVLSQLATTCSNYGMLQRHRGKSSETDRLYRRSLELRRILVEQNPGQADRLEDLAISYNNYGFLMRMRRRRQSAIPLYRKSIELREQLTRDNPDVPSYRKRLAFALAVLAKISPDPVEKELLLQRAFQIRQRLTEEFPRNPEHWEELARAYGSLNRLLTAAGRASEVELLADELADAHERYLNIIGERLVIGAANPGEDIAGSDDPTGSELSEHAELVEAFVTRADELRQAGNPLRALPIYTEADQRIDRSLQESPNNPDLLRSRALISYSRSAAMLELGRPTEAAEHCQEAITLLTSLTEGFPEAELHWLRLIRCWKHRADILSDQQQFDESRAATMKAADYTRELAARFPQEESWQVDLANVLKQIAAEMAESGNAADAERMLNEATGICRRLHESSPARRSWRRILAVMLLDRGNLRCRNGQYESGFSDLKNATELNAKLLQEKSLYEQAWCRTANQLAWQFLVCRDEAYRNPAEALLLAQQVVQLRPADDDYQNTLGIALYRQNQLKEARQALDQAVLLNGGDALDYYPLAMVHLKLNQPQKAIEYMDLATKWCRENQSSDEGLAILREEAEEVVTATTP